MRTHSKLLQWVVPVCRGKYHQDWTPGTGNLQRSPTQVQGCMIRYVWDWIRKMVWIWMVSFSFKSSPQTCHRDLSEDSPRTGCSEPDWKPAWASCRLPGRLVPHTCKQKRWRGYIDHNQVRACMSYVGDVHMAQISKTISMLSSLKKLKPNLATSPLEEKGASDGFDFNKKS